MLTHRDTNKLQRHQQADRQENMWRDRHTERDAHRERQADRYGRERNRHLRTETGSTCTQIKMQRQT
jgi:hypothetical protein